MNTKLLIEQAREIVIEKQSRLDRDWTIGEVLQKDGLLGIRDLYDGSFEKWEGLNNSDLGLTVLAVQDKNIIYLDSDEIRHFIPYIQKESNLNKAILAFDKDIGGPPMGRNFALESAFEILSNKWGRTKEGASISVERAVKRAAIRNQLEIINPVLENQGLEFHAYARNGKPSPPQIQTERIIVETAYHLMPEGKEKALKLATSRIATVDDVIMCTKNFHNVQLLAYFRNLQNVYENEKKSKEKNKIDKTR